MTYTIVSRLITFENQFGTLRPFMDRFESSSYKLDNLPVLRLTVCQEGSEAEWRKVLESLGKDKTAEMLLLLTDSERVQQQAVFLKLKRLMPTIVMRWWDEPVKLERSFRNRLIFNRFTGINFVSSRAMLQVCTEPSPGLLSLENPVLLDQPELLGDDSPLKMMRHTLQSLTMPSRVDIFGCRKRDYSHVRLTVATHFYCNQQNIDTIISLLQTYAGYPADLLDRIQFVVVDDGSPVSYTLPDFQLNLTWLRIERDIRWNQAGARNLALLFAKANNVVISDVDHSFPERTLRWLVGRDVACNRFFKFYRKMPDGSLCKGHPNIFYLSRACWFQYFGTDEEFAGAYGAEDYRFVKNFKNHGIIQAHLPKQYYCLERQVDRQASYHSLARDLSFNTPIDTRKRMEAEYFGKDYSHSRSCLNFSWTVVLDRERELCMRPKLNRTWRSLWWFRTAASFIASLILG